MRLALVDRRLGHRNAGPWGASLVADGQRDGEDSVRQQCLCAAGTDRFRQLDLSMRCPNRPLVLNVVLLLLRIARLSIDSQLLALQANVHGVVVRARDGDGHRDLIVGLINVDRRRYRDELGHKTSSNTRGYTVLP